MEIYDIYLHICRVIYSIVWAWLDLKLLLQFVRSTCFFAPYPSLCHVRFLNSVKSSLLKKWQQFKTRLGKYPRKVSLLRKLHRAQSYQEWLKTASALDGLLGLDEWRRDPNTFLYNYNNITERIRRLRLAVALDEPRLVCNTIRTGLIRNMVNIAVPELYNVAYAGTKDLIEEYAVEQVLSIRYVMELQTTPPHHTGFSTQTKMDFIRGARQGLGRSTLLLQGGSVFGLCHIGVVRALYYENMLPRVITGTATGAFVAAMVCIKNDKELEPFLDGESIDVREFAFHRRHTLLHWREIFAFEQGHSWIRSIFRRTLRYINENYCPDLYLLREYARRELGDLTFEEAYKRTYRVLNITIAIPKVGGVPNLLNFVTAPNVLIWSAAVASCVSALDTELPVIWCKDDIGKLTPWNPKYKKYLRSWYTFRQHPKSSPLRRLPQLFNVNHFIISQPRPFMIPVFGEGIHHPGGGIHPGEWRIFRILDKLVGIETRHRLRQLNVFGLLPTLAHRIFIDDDIPGSSVVVLPDLALGDLKAPFTGLAREKVKDLISKGERGVWPSMSSLKVRCVLEMELESAFQEMTGKKDNDLLTW
ncbi:triacylglycerol lipase [Ophidiomyces ophidiicola]|nr:triacylglycerol lipase [Ophidiomyces ophidiicola]